jgi:hypothetical protein
VHPRRTVLIMTLPLVLVLLAGGCFPSSSLSPDEKAVRTIIQRYDKLLADGYRALNMNGMREVASQLQAEDEYIHMSSLAEGGMRLDSELRSLEFLSVSVEATSARAETRETWDYRQYSRATGALLLEQKGLVYHLAWDLARQPNGGWLVTEVRAISSTATVEPRTPGTITPTPPGR